MLRVGKIPSLTDYLIRYKIDYKYHILYIPLFCRFELRGRRFHTHNYRDRGSAGEQNFA